MPSVSNNNSCVTRLSDYQVTANAKLCIGHDQLQCQLYFQCAAHNAKRCKESEKEGRKARWNGELESKWLEKVAEGKEGSKGGNRVCLAKGKLEHHPDLCDTAPRLKCLLLVRVRGRGVLAGSPGSPLLLFLDTPLLLRSRLGLGSIAAAFIGIHTLHTIVLCTHHHTPSNSVIHLSAPHAEAYTCCWPCLWYSFHSLCLGVNPARTRHVRMYDTTNALILHLFDGAPQAFELLSLKMLNLAIASTSCQQSCDSR